jgi:ketosteroid isomerase-like protein
VAERDTRYDRFREVSAEPWAPFRLLGEWDISTEDREQQLRDLEDEARILDLMINYAASHDAKDLDWTMSKFSSDDAPNSDGIPRRQDILDHYLILNYLTHNFSRHRYSNFIIRVLEGGEEAWMTGYWNVSRTGYPGEVTSRFGRYFWSFEKEDGQWRIGDRRSLPLFMFDSEFQDDDTPPQTPPSDGPVVSDVNERQPGPSGTNGRSDFDALGDDPLAAHEWVFGRPVAYDGKDAALDRLIDDRSVRELLARYSYALDSQDFEWLGSLFSEDAVVVSSRGRAEGKSVAIDALRRWQEGIEASHHRLSNAVLRVLPGGDEAWFTAYFHHSTIGVDDVRQSTFGTYLGRLVRRSGRWLIADWRIFDEAPLGLNPTSRRSAAITMPDIPEARFEFDTTVNQGAWHARRWLIEMPKPPDGGSAQINRLTDELDIREMLGRYVAAVDAKNLAEVISHFCEDAVVTTTSGRFRTLERISPFFEGVMVNRYRAFHRLTNTTVRFAPHEPDAWVSSIFFSVSPGRYRAADGYLLSRLRKEVGAWKFADLQLSLDRPRFFVTP